MGNRRYFRALMQKCIFWAITSAAILGKVGWKPSIVIPLLMPKYRKEFHHGNS